LSHKIGLQEFLFWKDELYMHASTKTGHWWRYGYALDSFDAARNLEMESLFLDEP